MKAERIESSGRHWAAALLALTWLGTHACAGNGGGSSANDTASNGAVGSSGGMGGTTGGAAGDNGGEAGGSAGETSAGGISSGGTSSGSTGAGGTSAGDDPFLPLYENGSRLRAVSLGEVGSSARRLMAWYDTELDTECSFGRAEDGELRCLPRRQSLGLGFLDAECTEPAYYDTLVVPCSDVPGFRGEEIDVNGCSGTRIVRMQQVSVSEVFHESCPVEPTELAQGATVWQDDEVLPPESFVAATERERMNTEGFGIRELVGEDGSRQVSTMLDGSRGACSPRELADAGWRCLPDRAFLDSPWWFADEACSDEPLAYGLKLSSCVEPVSFALSVDIEGGGLPSVLSLGEPVSGAVYEQSFSTMECTAHQSEDLLWTLYPVEGPFDETELFELTQSALGEGRVRTFHNTIGETPLTLVPGDQSGPVFFDAESDAPCVAFRHEGAWLCLPEGYVYSNELLYADSDCSEPVIGLISEAEVVLIVERSHCVREGFADDVLEVYATEGAYTGNLYSDASGDCLEADPSADRGYYRVAPAAGEYAELEEVIE